MNLKIGVISYYSAMKDSFEHLAEQENCELIFKVGVVDLAIDVAVDLEQKEKVDAIIATSKTANMIKQYVNVPVIPLHLKDYHLIDAFYKAKASGERLAFSDIKKGNVIYDISKIKEILGYDIAEYYFDEISQTTETINKILSDKRTVIITTASCMIRKAEKIGLNTVLITHRYQDFIEAIHNAKILSLSKIMK